ncbi:MAG: hypothetical protein D6689_12115 [Deltaproteobacteria bacterium]|nr:MAG: hypothetical protein D6689_12115 [Deltaproteobacteria bacterium]
MAAMGEPERRRWRRLRAELPLQLQLEDAAGGVEIRTAVGSHLNPTGIFVQVDDPPAVGTRVRITLNAEATDGVLSAEGQVVDCVVSGDGPPGVGIRVDRAGPGWTRLYDWLVDDR